MTIDDIVGKQVMMLLKPDAFKLLDIKGFESHKFYATISGVDNFGVWIEDDSFCITPAYDMDGNFIPASERKEACYNAHILVQWQFIVSLIYLPERQGLHPAMEEEGRIGFIERKD